MPGPHPQARIENARSTIRREAQIVTDIARDVRERLGQSAMEPSTGRGLGGVLGQRGSLVKAPIVLVSRTADNLIEHVQGFARINRDLIR